MSIRRIAELADLSPCTVSLALHHHPKIPAATRRRVWRIARKLGYRPNTKVAELMTQIRLARAAPLQGCLGVISLYDSARPWANVPHLERIYAGMEGRATALGYRLEPFWLRAPGMNARRLRRILDTRGVQGLLCFGSPRLEDELPPELNHFAIVTQGVSIRTPLHRIASHAFNDMWRVLRKVHELGYKRPGLILGEYEGERSAHAYLCVYLGWYDQVLGTPPAVPVLRQRNAEEEPLLQWLDQYRPDVLIFAHHWNALAPFNDTLRRHGIRVPADIGVVAITQILDGSDFSGLQSNSHVVGEWAVELVVGRIANSDFGFPTHPRIEMVEMQWVDGKTLRRQT